MERINHLGMLIAELGSRDGSYATPIPGLYVSRYSTTTAPRTSLDRAVLCVVAQGAKSILVHDQRYVYDPSTYLLVSLDLPLVGQVEEATPTRPFLGLSLELDFAEIGALLLDADLPVPSDSRPQHSVAVSPLDDDLLDAVIRLTSLVHKPAQVPILAPLVRREIFYKLLLSEQSGVLHRMTIENTQVRRIAAGVAWLKQHITQPIRMDELAREVHMSPSTMYFWFKAVTHMSPLQFQKHLRLQEARRLLLSETIDATTASQRVGYESASQFSREYRRLFGLPPLQDIERLRSVQEDGSTPASSSMNHPGVVQNLYAADR